MVKTYENHISYGCHGNKYGQKNVYFKKIYNFDIRLSFYDALKKI